AVRVSMLCFCGESRTAAMLDGREVERINADLTGAVFDLTNAERLAESRGVAFMGDTKGGAFDIPGDLACEWLKLPLNPNGHANAAVLRPWANGMDVTRRPSGKWIIDFGWTMTEVEASLYEAPFSYAVEHIQRVRATNNRETYARFWWRHVEPRQGMWERLKAFE